MRTYFKSDTKCKHVIGGSGGKRQNEKHHYDTGISDISLAVRRKVKQRDLMNVLATPETYNFIKTDFLDKCIKYRSQKEFGNYSDRSCSKCFYWFSYLM